MRYIAALLLASVAALPAQAEMLPFIPSEPLDGPLLAVERLPADFDAPLTEERLMHLADFDGDSALMDEDGRRMLALLDDLLSNSPVVD